MLTMGRRWAVIDKTSPILVPLILILTFLSLYIWRLGSLTTGLSPAEASARESSARLSQISADPVFAPHRVVQWTLQEVGFNELFGVRLASVIFAGLFLCFFY